MRFPPALTAIPVLLLLLGGCGSGDPSSSRDVEVSVRGVGLDPRTDTPVVVLHEKRGDRSLPIWIGTFESRSIAVELEHLEAPRPNTHDLAKRLLSSLDAGLDRMVVTRLLDGTYYAILVVNEDGRSVEIDSRPSDAIAIALRMGAPLFVREHLFEPVEIGDALSDDEGGPEVSL